jgi:hypothetical protein
VSNFFCFAFHASLFELPAFARPCVALRAMLETLGLPPLQLLRRDKTADMMKYTVDDKNRKVVSTVLTNI